MKYNFTITSTAASRRIMGGVETPINVARGEVACTLNTRYNDMALPLDIVSLRHFPKTVVFVEYET